MKRLTTIILGIIGITFFATTPVFGAEYPSLLRITSAEDYLIIGVDENGNEWSRIDCSEDWMTGDLAAVIFDDKGTASVYDDEIMDMRYVGYLDLYR